MAAEPGGRADKLGNRYEMLWVARQMLMVLSNKLLSVQLEPLGEDEPGVDLWVTEPDGTRRAQQCKRANRSAAEWTIPQLKTRRVLGYLRDQLQRSSDHRFTFVSGTPVPALKMLCDRARKADGDSEAFYEHSIQKYQESRAKFAQFCDALALDSNDKVDRYTAWDLLCRTDTHLFQDSHEERRALRCLAESIVEGEPQAVIESLAGFALDNIGATLHPDQIADHLQGSGFRLLQIAHDRSIPSTLEELRRQFSDSLEPFLISKHVLQRPETQQLIGHLRVSDGPRLIILHGRYGDGKSVVLLEFVRWLERQQILHLPLRLDRKPPVSNPAEYGKQLGLPASPVHCIGKLAGDRQSVLVLDQLDALRWSQAHHLAGWDTCRAMLRQAMTFDDVFVVLACRTFDLQGDPQFRTWIAEEKHVSVEVGDFPQEHVEAVVQANGASWSDLSEQQKTLLRSPLNLSLWEKMVADSGILPDFASRAQLMRCYRENRFAHLHDMAVPYETTIKALDDVVDYLDRNGIVTAPARLLGTDPRIREALQSLELIRIENDKVVFAHQALSDFLIADRLATDLIRQDRSLPEWLLSTDQSLIRRNQLRLLLALLHDDDPVLYAESLGAIIEHDGIRFHVKHLVLQHVGALDAPTRHDQKLVFEIHEKPDWHSHVEELVFLGHPPWFNILHQRNLVKDWLASGDDRNINFALRLMSSVQKHNGDQVVDLVEPYLDAADPWPKRIVWFLAPDPADDCSKLFDMRLSMTRRGQFNRSDLARVSESLVERNPRNAVLLLEAALLGIARWLSENDRNAKPSQIRSSWPIDEWYDQKELRQLSTVEPLEIWRRIPAGIEAVAIASPQTYQANGPFTGDDFWSERAHDHRGAASVVVQEMLSKAGAALYSADPTEFWTLFDSASRSECRFIQQICLQTLLELPDECAARALNWLSQDTRRLRLSQDRNRSPWWHARSLIARFGSTCSEGTFKRMEKTILTYRDPREHPDSHYPHPRPPDGYLWANAFGKPTLAFLSALPHGQLSDEAQSKLGQCERKFGSYERLEQDQIRSWSGMVHSAIPHEAIPKISDKGWLRIIRRTKPGSCREMWHWQSNGRTEATPEYFARDLEVQAKREPQRFAQLALHIPKDADPAYLEGILRALRGKKPPDEQNAGSWEAATGEQIEAVLRYLGYDDRLRGWNSIFGIIHDRADANWSGDILDSLTKYATKHSDPAPESVPSRTKGSNDTDEWIDDLETSAINCVRGNAVRAIGSILYKHPDYLNRFLPAIRFIVTDQHCVVRVAVIHVCLPVLNIDEELAVELFLKACSHQDDRILAAHDVHTFIAHASHRHLAQLGPLVTRMVNSTLAEAARSGAVRAAAAWLQFGAWKDLLDQCLVGSAAHRKGVAQVVSDWLRYPDLEKEAARLLIQLLDDLDKDVRTEAAAALRYTDFAKLDSAADIAQAFVRSRAFGDNPVGVLEALEDTSEPLIAFAEAVFATCTKMALEFAEPSRDPHGRLFWRLEALPGILLRLYDDAEQVQNADIASQCLDTWDLLLQSRIGGIGHLLHKLDD